jgi:hypothetical protein
VTTSDEARIARRYPKRGPLDYLLFGGLGLGVAATIVVAAVSGVQQSTPPVAAMVRSFDVISPTQIDLELVVQREDPSKPAQCEVFAQAASYEEVGEATLDIPADEDALKPYRFTITTVKEAAAVDVERCRIAGE